MCIDQGNSRTKVALFKDGVIVKNLPAIRELPVGARQQAKFLHIPSELCTEKSSRLHRAAPDTAHFECREIPGTRVVPQRYIYTFVSYF